ncbi:hypothetical protein D3C74_317540 [compost metagenome]
MAVRRETRVELLGVRPGVHVHAHGAVEAQAPVLGAVRVQVALVPGLVGDPAAVEVVALDVEEVDRREEALVEPAALTRVPAAGRRERREQVVLTVLVAQRVERGAELLHEEQEVLLVLGACVGGLAARDGPLPVDVDAVEDAGRSTRAALVTDLGQVALDVDVEARVDEPGAPLGRRGGLGEVVRPGPATQRHEDLGVRADLLELAELVEVARERLAGLVGLAVHGALGGDEAQEVVLRVTLAGLLGDVAHQVGRDVAERVVEVGQVLDRARGHEVRDVEVARDRAVGHEVADAAVAVDVVGACGRRSGLGRSDGLGRDGLGSGGHQDGCREHRCCGDRHRREPARGCVLHEGPRCSPPGTPGTLFGRLAQ